MKISKGGIFQLEHFNLGGLAASKWSGTENAYYKLTGWDLHSTPGLLKVAQKLTKDSGAIVTELCKARVSSSNGAQYWGSSESGKIWERTSGGTWRLVHTLTPSAGEAKVLGMMEYQDYIYIATQSRLHRIAVADADDNDWATDCTEDWANFSVTDADFHPMCIQNQILFIGDGNYVAQVDAGTFTADALDIASPLRVKSLGRLFTDLLIGTYVSAGVAETEILRWNTWAASFTNSDPIPEVGINAFLQGDNFVLVQAGIRGNLYFYDGTKLEHYKKIPGDYSPTAYGEVYPTAVASLGELMLFGFSNGSGNPADQGVYQFGRNGRDYPYVIDMPFPISERSGDDLVLSGIEIGAILVVGSDLYVSWKHGASYGVDKLDWSNKLEAGYLETTLMSLDREKFNTFAKFLMAYASLPDDTAINMAYKAQHAADYTSVADNQVVDEDRLFVYAEELGIEATVLQLKVSVTVDGNNAPEIESGGVFPSRTSR